MAYTLWSAEMRLGLSQPFKEKFGLEVEFLPGGRGPELIARVQAERRAGLYIADVFGIGNTSLLPGMKPEGLLGSIKPLLILPEVLDPQAWRGNRIPFTDDEGMAISMLGKLYRSVMYNTDIIKEGEITSYRDLLRPQYKGRITLNDPSVSGAGNSVIAHLGINLWGEAETTQFLMRLIKEQKVVIQRDSRIHIESVARGKYAVALGPRSEEASQFLALVGAPVKMAMVEEDNRVSTGNGAMGVPVRFAHPDATVVFVNWLLTKEGQSALARASGNPSNRLDASTEGVDSLFIPVPGKKYYDLETEESKKAQDRWVELARKIMEEAAK